MDSQNEHFRDILFLCFQKGKTASQAHKKLCEVYGDKALKKRQCHNWFAKFRAGDFSLKDGQRTGRPVEINDEQIEAIIDADPHKTTREIADKLNVSQPCIVKRLKKLGYEKRIDLWVPPSSSTCNDVDKKNDDDN